MRFKDDGDLGGGGIFVRLKDGDSITGIFQGEPIEYRQHFSQAERKGYLCTESAECPRCGKGEKSSFRFRLNFVVNENGKYVSKIFEQGWTVYESLRELNKEYPLDKTLVKISRKGEGMSDTQYFVLPAAQQLTAEKLAEIGRMEPLNLTPFGGDPHSEDFDKVQF